MMNAFYIVLCAVLSSMSFGELVMVHTLTRHGERAPDKIIAQQSCTSVWTNKDDIKTDYKASPGRLTPIGVNKMRKIGKYLRERYIDEYGFVSSDYQTHQEDWIFTARSGDRQQRSMSAIVLGILPNEPVAFIVLPRTQDYVLGGPAPACGEQTAAMISAWHKKKGWEMLQQHMDDVIKPIEKICQVNLTGNPVNAEPGGPNPHAWLGDISDSVDAAFANSVHLPDSITPELHEKLTALAFDIEQDSHYEDPQGAIMFTGGFPDTFLSDYELWENNPRRAKKKSAKMKLYSCSRELLYGLQKLFGWSTKLDGQPAGRVLSASTFIWELHREDGKLFIRTLHYHPSMDHGPRKLQPDMSIYEYRAKLNSYLEANGGPWNDICDFEHYNPTDNEHNPSFINPTSKHLVFVENKKTVSSEKVVTNVTIPESETVGNETVLRANAAKVGKSDGETTWTGWNLYGLVFVSALTVLFCIWRCLPGSSGYEQIA